MVGMSDNEPVAWVVFADDGSDAVTTCLSREVAGVIAEAHGFHVAPLYSKPMLTEEEREAIERVAIHCADTSCEDTAKTLWGLLQRLGY
jgi:stage III sporulation protein SpoIIIAA